MSYQEEISPKKPPNFSWIQEGKLCAMGFPEEVGHLMYLQEHGVTHLISLTAEREPPIERLQGKCEDPTLHSVLPLVVIDFTPPSISQIERCLDIIEEENMGQGAVGIHCAKGYGRTGTVIACYYVKMGGLTAVHAIEKVRMDRPGSLETDDQENRVCEFESMNKNRIVISPADQVIDKARMDVPDVSPETEDQNSTISEESTTKIKTVAS
ncbi:hypothetical protein FSP39_024952 [Pinctada imbricata]|uniref:Dual specificity protein phosphatase 23 n=1 Tax=Pinctada imbricata TaxID=66713 RepID=A0AA88XTI7_PINIB|nr:hypothetical protein FSP39_024952 [Pinctada imbricata]